MAFGVPDDLYWQLTPLETGALLDELVEQESRRERAANLRAGLITAAIYNSHRSKKTDRVWHPEDFIKEKVVSGSKGDGLLPPEALAGAMDSFMVRHNRAQSRKRHP